jgi:hypothetical protein
MLKLRIRPDLSTVPPLVDATADEALAIYAEGSKMTRILTDLRRFHGDDWVIQRLNAAGAAVTTPGDLHQFLADLWRVTDLAYERFMAIRWDAAEVG